MAKTSYLVVACAVCAGLLGYAAGARALPADAAQGDDTAPPGTGISTPAQGRQPMNLDEPMKGGMKKGDMKKGDVSKSAAEKTEELKKRLRLEEQSLPPMPSPPPRM